MDDAMTTTPTMRQMISLLESADQLLHVRQPLLIEGIGTVEIESDYDDEDSIEVDYCRNPSPQQFAGMMRKSRKRLRGFLDGADLYVWPAKTATHSQMEGALGILDPDTRLSFTEWGMTVEENAEVDEVAQHPRIRLLYPESGGE